MRSAATLVVLFCASAAAQPAHEPARFADAGPRCPVCGTPAAPTPARGLAGPADNPTATGLSSGNSVTAECTHAILELGSSDLRPANLLDLQGRTLRFTPDIGGFRVSNLALQWDAVFGSLVTGEPSAHVALTTLQFPFSGNIWSSIYVGTHGVITFGAPQSAFYDPGANRFLLFREFAGSMTNTLPIISPLFRRLGVYDPDGVNRRWVKQLADRIVVTWEMSEPYRDVFAFTSTPRMNRFQAVLYNTGVIELSYLLLSVQDGIVGVFPLSVSRASWVLSDPEDPSLQDYFDTRTVSCAVAASNRLRFTFKLRGPVPPPGDSRNAELLYRVLLDLDEPLTPIVDFGESDVDFGAFGDVPSYQYFTYSPHVDASRITVDGSTISFEASMNALAGQSKFAYFADSVDFNAPPTNFDQAGVQVVDLPTVLGASVDSIQPSLPGYIDVTSVAATLVGNHSVRFTFNLRGEPFAKGTAPSQMLYRIWVDLDAPLATTIDLNDVDREWYAYGPAYTTGGPGVSRDSTVEGNTVSFMVPLAAFGGVPQFAFYGDVVNYGLPSNNFNQFVPVTVTLPAINTPSIDLSAAVASDPPREVVYEAFHYPDLPHERELSAAVIAVLGDRFDFLAFYTDFRLDRQETGSSFSGAIGNKVTGVVPVFSQPQDWGSADRLQGVQLVNWIDTPLAAPSGVDLSGAYTGYEREVTLLCHELGHRWLSIASATVGGSPTPISDGAPHWLLGLHAPAMLPASSATDASFMGGAYWQDNGAGVFTNLTQPFFAPGGYSPLDLYYMGLAPKESVPPFFLVQNLVFSHWNPQGKPVYNGTRLNLTVDDVIAYSGPRLPVFASSQRNFTIGIVGVVQNGASPSATMRTRLDGIAHAFTSFWTKSTGSVGRMHAIIRGDADTDGDIDAADVIAFRACASGPTLPQPNSTCRGHFDFDDDGDVDADDFGDLQACFTGAW